MPIRVRCQCGQKLKVPDVFAGRRVQCPVCKTEVPIPLPEPGAEPQPVSGEGIAGRSGIARSTADPEVEPQPRPDRAAWSDSGASVPSREDEEEAGPMPWDPARSGESPGADPIGVTLFGEEDVGKQPPNLSLDHREETESALPLPGPELPPTEAIPLREVAPEPKPEPEPEPGPTEEIPRSPTEPGLPETEEGRPAFPGSEPISDSDASTAGEPGASRSAPLPEISGIGEDDLEENPPPTLPASTFFLEPMPEASSSDVQPEDGSSLAEPFFPSSWDDPTPPLPSPSGASDLKPTGSDDEAVSIEVPPDLVDLIDATTRGPSSWILPRSDGPTPPGTTPEGSPRGDEGPRGPTPAILALTRWTDPEPPSIRDAGPGRRSSNTRGCRTAVGVVLGLSTVLGGVAVGLGTMRGGWPSGPRIEAGRQEIMPPVRRSASGPSRFEALPESGGATLVERPGPNPVLNPGSPGLRSSGDPGDSE